MRKINVKAYDQIPLYQGADDDMALERYQDGFIPVSRIDHWKEIEQFVPCWKSRELIFRGHKEGNWTLCSSFARLCNNHNDQEETEMLTLFRTTLKEMDLLDSSKKYYHEYDNDHLWGLGRHYGLLTPTLDWSEDPLVALFFAFEDSDNNEAKNPYSAIYFLDKNYVEKNLQDRIKIINSIATDNYRAINQKGLFTKTISADSIEDVMKNKEESYTFFRKLYIKRIDQRNCIQFLEEQGIHKKNLYPHSLEGAIHYCNLKGQKFLSKIFPGGPVITFSQKVGDASAEQKKIAQKFQDNNQSLEDNEAAIAAKYVFEIMHQFRQELSGDPDFVKKWKAFYDKNFNRQGNRENK